jgi:hypothetical protein
VYQYPEVAAGEIKSAESTAAKKATLAEVKG